VFTGIITSLGVIVELSTNHLVIDVSGVDEELGASIAVDGCCLTLVASEAREDMLAPYPGAPPMPSRRCSFDVLPETIARTRLAACVVGDLVNVEPALRAGAPLGGHLVQGHIDDVGVVAGVKPGPDDEWRDVLVDVPSRIARYCIDRGSITVNGVSLTVMEIVNATRIRVQLIPETQARTNLGRIASGNRVNLEADVIARYVERLLEPSTTA
jgi:riboflavin synthase